MTVSWKIACVEIDDEFLRQTYEDDIEQQEFLKFQCTPCKLDFNLPKHNESASDLNLDNGNIFWKKLPYDSHD